MKKIILSLLLVTSLFFSPNILHAQDTEVTQEVEQVQQEVQTPNEFSLAQVKEVIEEGNKELGQGLTQPFQKVRIKILMGAERGKEFELEHGALFSITDEQKVKRNELVVLTKSASAEGEVYYIADRYRIGSMAIVLVALLLILAVLGRGKNMGLIVSLIGSFVVAYKYLIPQLLLPKSPYLPIILSVAMILLLLVYVGHGITKKTTIALISSLIVGLGTVLLSEFILKFISVTGSSSVEAVFLQTGAVDLTSLKNMLLASLTLGILGLIVHISMKQFEIVEMIKAQSKKSSQKEMFMKSIINPENNLSSYLSIVFMAFFAAHLPLMILFTANPGIPFWVSFNSEFIMGEVVRILISLLGIILIIPVTSLLTVNAVDKK